MKDMNTLKFFKNAQKLLEQSGKEDEAFYFEQMVIGYLVALPTEEQTIKARNIGDYDNRNSNG